MNREFIKTTPFTNFLKKYYKLQKPKLKSIVMSKALKLFYIMLINLYYHLVQLRVALRSKSILVVTVSCALELKNYLF